MTLDLETNGPPQILCDWPITITVDMVLRGEGANPAKIRVRQPQLFDLAERAIVEGYRLIRPRVVFRRLGISGFSGPIVVLGRGHKLEGSGIARKLVGSQGVFVAVTTLGKQLEEEMSKASQENLPWQFALDGFGTAAIGALSNAVCRFFQELAAKESFRVTDQFCPGMQGWRLAEGQTQIFALLDANRIGVALSSTFVMRPRKSLSMVVGFGTEVRTSAHLCDECTVSAKCRHKPANNRIFRWPATHKN